MYDWMPAKSTIFAWKLEKEEFSDQYARAKRAQADLFAEECIEIADNEEEYHQSRRVRIDTRKWIASRLLPKVYGDTNQLAALRVDSLEAENERMREKLKKLRSHLDAQNCKEY